MVKVPSKDPRNTMERRATRKTGLPKEKTLFRRNNKLNCNWSHQSGFPLIDRDIITRSLQVRHAAATKRARVTNGGNRAVDSPVVPASSASSHHPPHPGTKAISVVQN